MVGWHSDTSSPITVEREQPLMKSVENSSRPTLVLSFNLDTTNASIEDRIELVNNVGRILNKFDETGGTAALAADGLTMDFTRRFHPEVLRRIKESGNIDGIRQEYAGVHPGRLIAHMNDRIAFANEAYEKVGLPMSSIGMLPRDNPNILFSSPLSFAHLARQGWNYQLLSYVTVPGGLRDEDRDRNIIGLLDLPHHQYAILLDRRAQYSLYDLQQGEKHLVVAKDLYKAAVRGAEKGKPFVFCRADIGALTKAGRIDELLSVIEDLCHMEQRKELSIIGAREAAARTTRYVKAHETDIPCYMLKEEELEDDVLSGFFEQIPYRELSRAKKKLAFITAAVADPRIVENIPRRMNAGIPVQLTERAQLIYHLIDSVQKPSKDPQDPLPNISEDHIRELRMYDIIARSTARDKRASP